VTSAFFFDQKPERNFFGEQCYCSCTSCVNKVIDWINVPQYIALETVRPCLATVPVQSCHGLLPKYGVSVSCASPFSNFHRYHVQLQSSINYLQTISIRKWSLVHLLSAMTRVHQHWHTWSQQRQACLTWYFDGSGGCKHIISRVN